MGPEAVFPCPLPPLIWILMIRYYFNIFYNNKTLQVDSITDGVSVSLRYATYIIHRYIKHSSSKVCVQIILQMKRTAAIMYVHL